MEGATVGLVDGTQVMHLEHDDPATFRHGANDRIGPDPPGIQVRSRLRCAKGDEFSGTRINVVCYFRGAKGNIAKGDYRYSITAISFQSSRLYRHLPTVCGLLEREVARLVAPVKIKEEARWFAFRGPLVYAGDAGDRPFAADQPTLV